MVMVGKGGGNFYLLILVFAGVAIHEASTTGQFILFSASTAGMLVFGRNKAVNWKLAAVVGTLVATSAFLGGYLSGFFDEIILKWLFVLLLVASGALMLVPTKWYENQGAPRFGQVTLQTGDGEVVMNLAVVLPVSLLTGFLSGMIGVSGGSFLVPVLVLACGLPMKTSVATVTPLIALSSLMGFMGHAFQGHFNPVMAIPLAVVAVVGGLVGGRFALQSKPKHLKQIFAVTNWLAALIMVINLTITSA